MSIGKSPIELYSVIGYEFQELGHLENAMTHSSYSNELRLKGVSYPSNERLEFLGDAVLETVISEYLYMNFKNKSGGRNLCGFVGGRT